MRPDIGRFGKIKQYLAFASLLALTGCNVSTQENPQPNFPISSPTPKIDNQTNTKPWQTNALVEQESPFIIHVPEGLNLHIAQIRSLCGEVRILAPRYYETPRTPDCADRINLLYKP
jgi:hypothetical protein